MKKQYTLTWNRKKGCFVANVRKPNGSGWMKKWLPKGQFLSTQSLAAEAWLISWLSDYTKTSIAPVNPAVHLKKTLALYLPRWLELRRKAIGTGYNTYRTYNRAVKFHILDHADFKHFSIQDFDITTELSQVSVIRAWIQSLSGAIASRLQVIGALRAFFNDAVAEGWLDENFLNPIQKRPVRAMVKELKELRRKTAEVKIVPWEQIQTLINDEKIRLSRRVRYVIALTTGARDAEIQALTWKEVYLEADIPYIQISNQLLSPGRKPARIYEDEIALGKDKLAILNDKETALISDPKTQASSSSVPLHPAAVKALKALFKVTPWKEQDDPVFSLNRKFFKTRAQVFRGDLNDHKFNSSTFHALRRTFATKLAGLGVDDGVIERLLRHREQSVARQHYIKDKLAPLYEAVCKLPVSFGSGDTKPLNNLIQLFAKEAPRQRQSEEPDGLVPSPSGLRDHRND